jgi:serine/threonine protein kinase
MSVWSSDGSRLAEAARRPRHPVDRTAFLEHLKKSRLVADEQFAILAARFAANVPAHSIADTLIEEGLLTRFQAKQIWAGETEGLVLGQYHILDELGKGGFGQVFKARHAMMGRLVAIKLISPDVVEDKRARGWFRREVLASTELCHPNIVMAYDADEIDDLLFFVMEYVDGPTLDSFVKAHGPLTCNLASEMMRQAALALQHAHEKAMVHRDIKPANLLIPRGAAFPALTAQAGMAPILVKVVDFGLARLHRKAPAGTLMLHNERGFLGTPDYVAPEQARNLHAVDIRSDLYSLGCTFYYALAGHRPFQGTTVLEVVVQHLEKSPPPLESLRSDVPAPLSAILKRLMAKDPTERFQTPPELVAALTPLCACEMFQTVPAGTQASPIADARDRTASFAASIGAAGTATALVSELAFWEGPVLRPTPEDDPLPVGSQSAKPIVAVQAENRRAASAPLPVMRPVTNQGSSTTKEAETPEKPFRASTALRNCWRQWVRVVEGYASGVSIRVDEHPYRLVRSLLLEHCQNFPAGSRKPAILRRLECIVEPWLSTRNFASTDRETLASLLRHCQEIDGELSGSDAIPWWPIFAVVVATALVVFLGWYLSRQDHVTVVVTESADRLWELAHARPLLTLAVTLPAVLLGALYGLSRLLRA